MDRETSLQQMRLSKQQRLDGEMPDEKEAHLHGMSLSQQQRLAVEMPEEREERLQQDMELHRDRRDVNSPIPMIEQPAVHSRMASFPSKLASVQILKCLVCFERFPALNMRDVLSSNGDKECVRCHNDKHIPKLYFSDNNTDPGPIYVYLLN